ncbi:MAG: SsrA-binding protein SmpB [Erysipelotrichia bacterium]|jgi:SsrA-binding protein|nr:SsrA-binding protein SmpB [Erysipelotrichia bacterium]
MNKIIANNKRAYHDYFIEEKLEAGIELTGTEIKSVRLGKVQFKDAFIQIKEGQAILKNMNIAPYEFGNRFNHEEERDRRLLLHKSEIRKWGKKVQLKGYTIIPLSMYLSKGLAKVEIGLALGKAAHDKRQVEKERDDKRMIAKAIKQRAR